MNEMYDVMLIVLRAECVRNTLTSHSLESFSTIKSLSLALFIARSAIYSQISKNSTVGLYVLTILDT